MTQVCILASGKAFFAGVGEEGRPGAIQIWKADPLEKVTEIMAHGREIERMRLSFDNKHLFTAGKDGCLMVHEVKDRDTKGAALRRGREIGNPMAFSEEVLTEKVEMEEYVAKKEQLNNELIGARDS